MIAVQDIAIFSVKVTKPGDGERKAVDVTDRIISWEFEDNEKLADNLKMTINNYLMTEWDDPLWSRGSWVDIQWGYAGNMGKTRRLLIEKVEGFTTLTIEATGSVCLMHREKKSKRWENKSRSQIVTEIAKTYGYKDDQLFIEDTKHVFSETGQANITDAEFIRRQADREGFIFHVDADGVHFKKRPTGGRPVKTLRWFSGANADIFDIQIKDKSKHKKGAVHFLGRSVLDKKAFKKTGSNEETKDHKALAQIVEVVDPKTGETTLQQRVSVEDIKPSAETDPTAAKRHADGEYRKQREGVYHLTATIPADPRIGAKSVIEISGIGKKHSGLWYVRTATTTYDKDTFTCALECGRGEHNGVDYNGGPKGAKTKAQVNDQKPSEQLREIDLYDPKTGVFSGKKWSK